jgi:copper chaperone
MDMVIEHLVIDGMSCGHCVAAVRAALDRTPGVRVLDVGIGHARIERDERLADRAAVEAAVAGEGYQVLAA